MRCRPAPTGGGISANVRAACRLPERAGSPGTKHLAQVCVRVVREPVSRIRPAGALARNAGPGAARASDGRAERSASRSIPEPVSRPAAVLPPRSQHRIARFTIRPLYECGRGRRKDRGCSPRWRLRPAMAGATRRRGTAACGEARICRPGTTRIRSGDSHPRAARVRAGRRLVDRLRRPGRAGRKGVRGGFRPHRGAGGTRRQSVGPARDGPVVRATGLCQRCRAGSSPRYRLPPVQRANLVLWRGCEGTGCRVSGDGEQARARGRRASASHAAPRPYCPAAVLRARTQDLVGVRPLGWRAAFPSTQAEEARRRRARAWNSIESAVLEGVGLLGRMAERYGCLRRCLLPELLLLLLLTSAIGPSVHPRAEPVRRAIAHRPGDPCRRVCIRVSAAARRRARRTTPRSCRRAASPAAAGPC